jgi:membrane protein YqaA with SNARE-associated domain
MATIESDTLTPRAGPQPRRRFLRRAGFVAFVLVFVAFAVWLATLEFEGALGEFVTRYGYAGYFIAACIAGINIFVPTTHLIFTAPLLNAGLNPWLLVVFGALGATLADGVGYFIGSSGRSAFGESLGRIAHWLTDVVAKRPRAAPVILFLWAAFMPLPNEILVIPAGVLGYGILRTGLITLGGNIVFNILAVVLGLIVL